MKESEVTTGKMEADSQGLGTVTPEMVQRRARELAVINGRSENQVTADDYEAARRELTGEADSEAAPEEIRGDTRRRGWDPAPGSPGHKTRNRPAPDEQREAESLVEEGVAEAEHEQMIEATRESKRRERQG